MTRTRAIVIAAVVGVVAVVAAVAWWVNGRSDDPRNPGTTAAPTSEPEQAAAALELLESDPQQLLPAELEGSVDLAIAIPDGTQVEADPESWVPSTAGGGVIEMTLRLTDGSTQEVLVVMAQVDGAWKVLQTIPTEGA